MQNNMTAYTSCLLIASQPNQKKTAHEKEIAKDLLRRGGIEPPAPRRCRMATENFTTKPSARVIQTELKIPNIKVEPECAEHWNVMAASRRCVTRVDAKSLLPMAFLLTHGHLAWGTKHRAQRPRPTCVTES
ncbi:hypothetical protein LX32DRAFT_331315 [Colletotrichum zoysiae]|uniref:Uncharacterized protein n=1 Tax=Colletotrichum zoysiae TaxID=1216348 RepID=A0AAD9M177_9PEZI|nr:hypothetical protein LX32DRAFT_331315 [Colletotrichum zoysiae]